MPLIDSHCHLNYPDFTEDFEAMLQRAGDAGISLMQTICTRMSEFPNVYAIADKHPQIYASVGVHPHESGKEPLIEVEELIKAASLPKVIGIGETGLDYYYEHSDRDIQQESFRRHIAAARNTGLPVIIHTRDADEDTISIMQEEMGAGAFKALIHCFTSSMQLAEAMLELGCYISISGIVTFKKAEALQEAVRQIPLERLLVETDAPYLAPMPHRGKRNEPAFTLEVCRKVAELKNIHVEECAKTTTANFFRLFDKATLANI